ncbi:hypothetical protein M413DRAFT_410275 [Hebeloma cylindrosporum]|uniref:Uncharacterized protein n=1 Tax=Hebeloma cylindrosporum TaxID=76867 RepID=A0A0C3CCB0_HEBCY|nr:hypothetical protein M413DRAFT_410275 [Hebeloma cylindrosporum h7]
MSFRITLGTHQDAGTPFFRVQQQPAVWTFGTASWSASNGERTLTMNQSGTSGILRFVNNNGERFAVIVGIDNRQRWCDIIPDDSPAQTSLSLLSRYYTRGYFEPKHHVSLASSDGGNKQAPTVLQYGLVLQVAGEIAAGHSFRTEVARGLK